VLCDVEYEILLNDYIFDEVHTRTMKKMVFLDKVKFFDSSSIAVQNGTKFMCL
jgi:hypothetical protein